MALEYAAATLMGAGKMLLDTGLHPGVLKDNVCSPGGSTIAGINVLEQEGIFVSNSSACKRGRRSHVLEAMGIPPKAIDGALRISFSRYTTEEDADAFCQALIRARQRYFPKR